MADKVRLIASAIKSNYHNHHFHDDVQVNPFPCQHCGASDSVMMCPTKFMDIGGKFAVHSMIDPELTGFCLRCKSILIANAA